MIETKKSVLWWGRSDPEYSRNRLVRKLFERQGIGIEYFHPLASQTGHVEAYLHRLNRPDLIWVPCFRHRDIFSASQWARKWKVPLVVDPLISAFEKEVYEKKKWPPGSRRAERKRFNETALFARTSRVVADTPAHGEFFRRYLDVPENKIDILYVGAETDLFRPTSMQPISPPFEVLFYGSFIQLQGTETIIEAALKSQQLNARWVLLGEGDCKAENKFRARGASNIAFESWVPYDRLPERISKANILLGIFGDTPKAELVIPNKVYQAMASARPVITRQADAYPEGVRQTDVIGWVPAGDPDALAQMVNQWLVSPALLEKRGQQTRDLFDRFFNEEKLMQQFERIMAKVL